MTDSPRLLTASLLSELERRWREQDAPVATALRPGLSDREMDALTEPLGFRLPAEARQWWGWHDGAGPHGRRFAAQIGPGDILFLPLSAAVDRCQEIRDVMRYAWADGFGPHWQHGWLPITYTSNPTVIDCSVPFTHPVPARTFIFEEPDWVTPGVPSLGELIQLWIRAIDAGAWEYDRTQEWWTRNAERIGPDMRPLNLV